MLLITFLSFSIFRREDYGHESCFFSVVSIVLCYAERYRNILSPSFSSFHIPPQVSLKIKKEKRGNAKKRKKGEKICLNGFLMSAKMCMSSDKF